MEKEDLKIVPKDIQLKEEDDVPGESGKKASTPVRSLRPQKNVHYTDFLGDDQDNSEDYVLSPKDKKEIISKKRQRPKSVTKLASNADTTKKEKEEKGDENKMNIEEDNKKNKGSNNYGTIINIQDTLTMYSNDTTNNNINNINIPNSDLILIILELCLNSSQFGIEKDNSSKLFWEEVGKLDILKPITAKFKPETLRKYWRIIREARKYKRIIQEIKRYKNELDNKNIKLLTSIKIICEYVSSPSKRKFDYFLNKLVIKPANKSKKINVNEMTPTEQISDIIHTFLKFFPKKCENDIVDALFKTSFDIENTYLILKDKDNLGFLAFSEKDDEIVQKHYEDNDDSKEEYQELMNTKGLEEILKRKEFLYDIKIDRNLYYNTNEDDIPKDNENEPIKEDVKDEKKNDKEDKKLDNDKK